jgi:ABC-type amino acid transport system permease subunit
MKIDQFIKDSWDIYVQNILNIVLAVLIAIVLSVFTLGILFPVLYTGVAMMFVRAKRGETLNYNDVFKYMNKWLTLLGLCSVILVCVITGLVFFILPGLLIASIWMFAGLLVVDKGLGVFEALGKSKDIVMKNNIWMHLVLILIIGFLSSVANGVPGIGFVLSAFVAGPVCQGLVACAYLTELDS